MMDKLRKVEATSYKIIFLCLICEMLFENPSHPVLLNGIEIFSLSLFGEKKKRLIPYIERIMEIFRLHIADLGPV